MGGSTCFEKCNFLFPGDHFLVIIEVEIGDVVMAIFIMTFQCSNPACRKITLQSGPHYNQIKCECCGSIMRLIKKERQD